jgi:hypothetical protein
VTRRFLRSYQTPNCFKLGWDENYVPSVWVTVDYQELMRSAFKEDQVITLIYCCSDWRFSFV